jgi:hypothetical protein
MIVSLYHTVSQETIFFICNLTCISVCKPGSLSQLSPRSNLLADRRSRNKAFILFTMSKPSRYSLKLDYRGNGVPFSAGSKRFFSAYRPYRVLGSTHLPVCWTPQVPFLEDKLAEAGSWPCTSSTAEFHNVWIYTSAPPYVSAQGNLYLIRSVLGFSHFAMETRNYSPISRLGMREGLPQGINSFISLTGRYVIVCISGFDFCCIIGAWRLPDSTDASGRASDLRWASLRSM